MTSSATTELIEWIYTSKQPLDSPESPSGAYRTGGELYDAQAVTALGQVACVSTVHFPRPRTEGPARFARTALFLIALRRHRPDGQLVFWEAGSLSYGVVRPRAGQRHVGMVHHLNYDRLGQARFGWFNRTFRRNLRHLDLVVTVSDHWQSALLGLGARRAEVIHNALPAQRVDFDPAEVLEFGRLHGLDDDRPVVYLGTSRREKGVVEAHQSLAHEGYQFVVSGGQQIPELPVLRVDLTERDYLLLLARSDVAVLMSTFAEGWCRTAQEAMHCGTPVVGSGLGGMQELLDGGGQITCASVASLPEAVRAALAERQTLGKQGRSYVAQFTQARFHDRWTTVARSMITDVGAP